MKKTTKQTMKKRGSGEIIGILIAVGLMVFTYLFGSSIVGGVKSLFTNSSSLSVITESPNPYQLEYKALGDGYVKEVCVTKQEPLGNMADSDTNDVAVYKAADGSLDSSDKVSVQLPLDKIVDNNLVVNYVVVNNTDTNLESGKRAHCIEIDGGKRTNKAFIGIQNLISDPSNVIGTYVYAKTTNNSMTSLKGLKGEGEPTGAAATTDTDFATYKIK